MDAPKTFCPCSARSTLTCVAILPEYLPSAPDHHPEDECYCGDYRKDHVGGTGVCKFTLNDPRGGHPFGSHCNEFRLVGGAGWRDA